MFKLREKDCEIIRIKIISRDEEFAEVNIMGERLDIIGGSWSTSGSSKPRNTGALGRQRRGIKSTVEPEIVVSFWKRGRISSRVGRLTSYLPTAGNSSSTTIHDAPWNWFWRIATGLSRQPLSYIPNVLPVINGRPTVDTWYPLFLYC